MAGPNLALPDAIKAAEEQKQWLIFKHMDIATLVMASTVGANINRVSNTMEYEENIKRNAQLATDAATALLAQYGYKVHLREPK